jgi:NAD(P)-dependent dehydrogenase (short-subunit alcohol dehydrogenase family)
MSVSRHFPFRCLVTGASRGVGSAIAVDLALARYPIAMTARTELGQLAVVSILVASIIVNPGHVTN